MIKYLYLVFILFHSFVLSQQGKGIIYLNDGSVQNGYVKNVYSDTILGIKRIDINKIIINDEVSKMTLVYERVSTNKSEKSGLLKVVFEGEKVKLYSTSVFKKDKQGRLIIPNRPQPYAYFAKKVNEKMATLIAYKGGSRFKINGAQFFSDCPYLAHAIKKGNIKFTNKITAFTYYEQNCN